jgi:hypothetical protein
MITDGPAESQPQRGCSTGPGQTHPGPGDMRHFRLGGMWTTYDTSRLTMYPMNANPSFSSSQRTALLSLKNRPDPASA